MTNEIVYVCNSINNKNIRGKELAILRKNEEQLCFEFGENEINLKKRYYKTMADLNKDYEEVEKIKQKLESKPVEDAKKEENASYTEQDADLRTSEQVSEQVPAQLIRDKKRRRKGRF